MFYSVFLFAFCFFLSLICFTFSWLGINDHPLIKQSNITQENTINIRNKEKAVPENGAK